MTSGPDEPTPGLEHHPPETSPPPVGPPEPLDYPTDPGMRPAGLGPHQGFGAAAYPPPPPGYPPPYSPQGGFSPPYPGSYNGYAGYPYDPYRQGHPVGTNGKAIASLVCSLVGPVALCFLTSPVGLVLGILAMRETKRTGQEGHGMALAGTIIGAIGTVILVVMAVVLVGAFLLRVTTLDRGY